jgi:hypothetical protein
MIQLQSRLLSETWTLGLLIAGTLAVALQARGVSDPRYNGFCVTNAIIPTNQIVRGGPPRDGIPAINTPRFISVPEASFLEDTDRIISFEHKGIVRAYPTRIMLWHEIVNDRFGEDAFVITYCPLCGTAMVFDAVVSGELTPSTFGVSGLLYQSDVLMYDRETESLWSQLALKSVAGPLVGRTLTWRPSQVLNWGAWKTKYPAGQVLSTNTGYVRNYDFNPYANYEQSQEIWFGVPIYRTDFANKDWIIGLLINERPKAYGLPRLPFDRPVIDIFQGTTLQITYDVRSQQPTVLNLQSGEALPFVMSFWFAWQAFYPDTEVWAPLVLQVDAQRKLTVTGESSKSYLLESSLDLLHWSSVATVTTVSNRAEYVDVQPLNRQRFYRARLKP